MEEVIASHPDVAECAVLGVKDEIKGEQPCGFMVLKSGVNRPPEEIEKEVVKLVRDKIGPVAAFKIGPRRRPPAEDPLRQDPARHDEEDRRPRPLGDAGDDRGPEGAGGDRGGAGGAGGIKRRLSAGWPTSRWAASVGVQIHGRTRLFRRLGAFLNIRSLSRMSSAQASL